MKRKKKSYRRKYDGCLYGIYGIDYSIGDEFIRRKGCNVPFKLIDAQARECYEKWKDEHKEESITSFEDWAFEKHYTIRSLITAYIKDEYKKSGKRIKYRA